MNFRFHWRPMKGGKECTNTIFYKFVLLRPYYTFTYKTYSLHIVKPQCHNKCLLKEKKATKKKLFCFVFLREKEFGFLSKEGDMKGKAYVRYNISYWPL